METQNILPQDCEVGNVAILAYHFSVAYHEELDTLIEAIPSVSEQVPPSENLTAVLKAHGDTPVRSLVIALNLIRSGRVGAGSRLWLLVDDRLIGQNDLPTGEEMAQRRRSFYQRINRVLPRHLQGAEAWIQAQNDPTRSPGNLLPPASVFLSEQQLLTRARRRTNATCSVGGCATAVFEVLRLMYKAGFRQAILFVPAPCWVVASIGIKQAVDTLGFEWVVGVRASTPDTQGENRFDDRLIVVSHPT